MENRKVLVLNFSIAKLNKRNENTKYYFYFFYNTTNTVFFQEGGEITNYFGGNLLVGFYSKKKTFYIRRIKEYLFLTTQVQFYTPKN